MYRLNFCLVFLFALTSVVNGQTPSEPASQWQRYVLAGEELSFELPQAPTAITIYRPPKHLENRTEELKKGRMYGAYGAGVVYLILSFENPDADSLDTFVNEVYRYPISGRPQKFERDLSLGGFHGKHFSFSQAVVSGLMQFYKSKRHVYLVEATSDDMSRPEIKRFLDSLSFASKSVNYDPDNAPPPQAAQTSAVAAPTPNPGTKTNGGPGVGMGAGSGMGVGVGPVQDGTGSREGGAVSPRGAGVGPAQQTGVGSGIGSGPGSSSQTIPTERLVLSGKDVSRKPIVVAKPEATYTEEARRNQITGTVVLKCVFTSSGRVERIFPIRALPFGLTERSIMAAKNIRFIPAQKDGKYVSQYMQLEYNFNLY